MYGCSEKSVPEALKEIFESTGLKVKIVELEEAYLITHHGETGKLVIEYIGMSPYLINLLESYKMRNSSVLSIFLYSSRRGASKSFFGWSVNMEPVGGYVITLHLSDKKEYMIDCHDINRAISSVKSLPVYEENLVRLQGALRFIKQAYEG